MIISNNGQSYCPVELNTLHIVYLFLAFAVYSEFWVYLRLIFESKLLQIHLLPAFPLYCNRAQDTLEDINQSFTLITRATLVYRFFDQNLALIKRNLTSQSIVKRLVTKANHILVGKGLDNDDYLEIVGMWFSSSEYVVERIPIYTWIRFMMLSLAMDLFSGSRKALCTIQRQGRGLCQCRCQSLPPKYVLSQELQHESFRIISFSFPTVRQFIIKSFTILLSFAFFGKSFSFLVILIVCIKKQKDEDSHTKNLYYVGGSTEDGRQRGCGTPQHASVGWNTGGSSSSGDNSGTGVGAAFHIREKVEEPHGVFFSGWGGGGGIGLGLLALVPAVAVAGVWQWACGCIMTVETPSTQRRVK